MHIHWSDSPLVPHINVYKPIRKTYNINKFIRFGKTPAHPWLIA